MGDAVALQEREMQQPKPEAEHASVMRHAEGGPESSESSGANASETTSATRVSHQHASSARASALQRAVGNRVTGLLAVQRLAISDEHGTRELPDTPIGPGGISGEASVAGAAPKVNEADGEGSGAGAGAPKGGEAELLKGTRTAEVADAHGHGAALTTSAAQHGDIKSAAKAATAAAGATGAAAGVAGAARRASRPVPIQPIAERLTRLGGLGGGAAAGGVSTGLAAAAGGGFGADSAAGLEAADLAPEAAAGSAAPGGATAAAGGAGDAPPAAAGDTSNNGAGIVSPDLGQDAPADAAGSSIRARLNGLAQRLPAGVPAGVQRLPELDVPAAPAVEMGSVPEPGTVDTSAISTAAQSVDVNGSAQGDDSVAGWLIDQATSAFHSLVSSVTGDAGSTAGSASTSLASAATSLFAGIGTTVAGLGTSLTSGFSGILDGHGGVLQGLLRTVKVHLKSTLHEAAGSVKDLQGQIKSTLTSMLQSASGNPIEAIRHLVTEQIDAAIHGIAASVNEELAAIGESASAQLAAVEAVVAAAAEQMDAFVALAEGQIEGVVETIRGSVDGFLDMATSALSGLPDAARALVESLLSTLRSAIDRFAQMVRDAAHAAAETITQGVAAAAAAVTATAEVAKQTILDLIRTISEHAEQIIHEAVDLALQIGRSIISAAVTVGEAAIKAMLMNLPMELLEYAIDKAEPYVVGWIMDALNIDLSDLPVRPDNPQQIAGQAGQLAQQAATSASSDFASGLLNPQGDHIAAGLYVTGSYTGSSHASGAVTLQGTLDLVTNFVTNQLGLFASLGVAGTVGAGSSTGPGLEGGIAQDWGTIQTFGRDANGKPLDMNNFSGRFFNVGASVGAGGPVEGVPVAVSTGDNIYMSGATTTPGTPSSTTTTPGTPGTTTPPTQGPSTQGPPTQGPSTQGPAIATPARSLGAFSAQFPTQSATPAADPDPAVSAAVEAMRSDVAANPGDQFNVDVVGHASNRWAAAGTDAERLSNNQTLSDQRATVIAGQVDRYDGGLPVNGAAAHHGVGVTRARGDTNTNDPADRRADITVQVAAGSTPGPVILGPVTPGQVTPGAVTPGTTTPGTPGSTVTTPGTPATSTGLNTGGDGPVGLWGPQTSGGSPLVGWDTTLNVGVSTSSKEVNASTGVSVGDSYSWPLLKPPPVLSPTAMMLVRAIMGLYKLTMDVVSLSPLGFLRDSMSLLSPVIDSNVDGAVDTIVDAVIPVPDEELA